MRQMNKLFFIFLFFISFSAKAEWTLYNISKGKDIKFYYDKYSIVKKNDVATVKEVLNYTEKVSSAKDGHLSVILVKNFDCVNVAEKIISTKVYDGHMGKGKLIQQDSYNKNWKNISPQSISYSLFSKVCW